MKRDLQLKHPAEKINQNIKHRQFGSDDLFMVLVNCSCVSILPSGIQDSCAANTISRADKGQKYEPTVHKTNTNSKLRNLCLLYEVRLDGKRNKVSLLLNQRLC